MDDEMASHTASHADCSSTVQQACAVPFRRLESQLEFCLITSSSGRWIFPKGIIDRGCSPEETALRESYEEAGLHGRILDNPLGCFEVSKSDDTVTVLAFLMEVRRSDSDWPEFTLRDRTWATAEQAEELISDPALREMLRAAKRRLASGP
jgi:8-oxo-dGTP pyrophosphatase MutT (NUDIX family)